jgi:hypothetical protein
MKRIGELKAENARLEHVVNYWKVEAETDNARWLRVLEENERLKAEVERLTKAGDAFYESEIGYYGEQILNDPKHHSGQMCRDWNAAKGVKS